MSSRIFGSFLCIIGSMLMVGGASLVPVTSPSNAFADVVAIELGADCSGKCDRCGKPERQNPGVEPPVYKCIRTNDDGTFSVGNCKTATKGPCSLCKGSCSDGLVGGVVQCGCNQ